jgi:hypothetical protein
MLGYLYWVELAYLLSPSLDKVSFLSVSLFPWLGLVRYLGFENIRLVWIVSNQYIL